MCIALSKPRIQKRLHMFDTGVDGVRLCLHIGLGCGEAIQGIVSKMVRIFAKSVI